MKQRPAASAIKVTDAGTHWTEPHDLCVSRAPAFLKTRLPQVKLLDGQMSWVIEVNKSIGTGAHPNSAIRKDGSKVRKLNEFIVLRF